MCVLASRLGLPENIVFSNSVTASREESMCMILRHLSYPNRLCDLISQFGRSESEMSIIINESIEFIVAQNKDVFAPWLKHEEFVAVITQKGSPLRNIWGFIDGTVM